MEGPVPVALVSPQKRPYEDSEAPVSTPNRAAPSNASTPLTVLSSIQTPSPAKNASSETTAPASSNNSVAGDAPDPTQDATASNSTQQPAKRRKLTPKEKEEQRLEKEAKAKARAEKKAQKEVEDKLKAEHKAQKEEEKRQRDEEKRKKNEEREEKKRAKEFEQQQKEEEKRKKERSQMRLNAFFGRPKAPADASEIPVVDTIPNPTTEAVSLPPEAQKSDANSIPPSPQKTIQKNAQTDYERYFLPFSLPSHAILAPRNAFMEDPAKLAAAQARVDKLIAQEDMEMEPINIDSLKASLHAGRRRGQETVSIADIVERINGSSDNPIDLTSDSGGSPSQPLELLKQIPMKYLHFPEDVRPPYYGTYTKPHSLCEASKLARNPISRTLREVNYDYDSEAEWEEPEEGEDLDSDGEEDLDDEGEDDMDGFLDDEDDAQIKRRLMSGDQEPVSTGLCWQDPFGIPRLNDGSDAISTEFKGFTMGFLLEPQPQSIDPWSTAYWTAEPIANTTVPTSSYNNVNHGSMNPPRLPLTQRPINGLLNTLNAASAKSSSNTASKPVKAKRMIPSEDLPAFKAEIEGQDLTKIGMIEALKKKFPKIPKDAITNTLTAVAKRVGPSEKEKRWVLTA